MTPFMIFILQVLILSIFPFYFATQRNTVRTVSILTFLEILLSLGGFFGAVYTLPITNSISISGGTILYGAFMMGTVLFFLVENDLSVFRRIIQLIITINIFVFFLLVTLGMILSNPATINLFNTSANIFNISIIFMIIGGILIIAEFLIFLFVFGKIKTWSTSPLFLALAFTVTFVFTLCFDGILFPASWLLDSSI